MILQLHVIKTVDLEPRMTKRGSGSKAPRRTALQMAQISMNHRLICLKPSHGRKPSRLHGKFDMTYLVFSPVGREWRSWKSRWFDRADADSVGFPQSPVDRASFRNAHLRAVNEERNIGIDLRVSFPFTVRHNDFGCPCGCVNYHRG